METSASFEARSAPSSYSTFRRLIRSLSLRPSWLLAPWADPVPDWELHRRDLRPLAQQLASLRHILAVYASLPTGRPAKGKTHYRPAGYGFSRTGNFTIRATIIYLDQEKPLFHYLDQEKPLFHQLLCSFSRPENEIPRRGPKAVRLDIKVRVAD